MTTMYQKMTVYTVLAVALGYLLISTVPSAITPLEGEMLATAEEDEIFSAPQPEAGVREPDSLAAEEKSALNEAFQYSVLIIDLLIALGVYIVAKRRFA
ncbi:MAG: hypothetical protein NWF12_03895 [Candidatus Bathyarchaeota archaeon]|jgi:hypothetical protein|nr:hypothetical protein [Candidatus Bathyarchaeota archaeon]